MGICHWFSNSQLQPNYSIGLYDSYHPNPLTFIGLGDMNNPTNSSVNRCGETFEVRFDGFADLPTTKSIDNFVLSPEFTCFGHRWQLRVHPGGNIISDDGQVAFYLYHVSDGSIEVQATLTIEATSTNTHTVYRAMSNHNFPPSVREVISTAMAMKILPSGRHSLGHSLLMCK